MKVETILFEKDDWVPNNPHLPVLVYRHAIEAGGHAAEAFAARFRQNGWQGIWRNGIFSYQHYHSRAHEVLGIASGEARVLLGGPGGREIEVEAGDCMLLPAGTGHCLMEKRGDFLVIGAYPPEQQADICTSAPSQSQLEAIGKVLLPEADPVAGRDGPLHDHWRSG